MFGKDYNEPMGTTDPEAVRRQSDESWLRLKDLDTCPKCGVSWVAILDSLETSPMGSEDLDQALVIIQNCDVCRIRFRREWYKIQR